MRLDRNIKTDRCNKYALLKLRRMEELQGTLTEEGQLRLASAIDLLEASGILDRGDTVDSEFFVVRLRDTHARPALAACADDIMDDNEYRTDIADLAARAGSHHPNCKKPD